MFLIVIPGSDPGSILLILSKPLVGDTLGITLVVPNESSIKARKNVFNTKKEILECFMYYMKLRLLPDDTVYNNYRRIHADLQQDENGAIS